MQSIESRICKSSPQTQVCELFSAGTARNQVGHTAPGKSSSSSNVHKADDLPVVLVLCNYRILSSKHPWVLEIHGQKTGVGAYTDKPFVYTWTRRIINKQGRALTRRWALIRERIGLQMPSDSHGWLTCSVCTYRILILLAIIKASMHHKLCMPAYYT